MELIRPGGQFDYAACLTAVVWALEKALEWINEDELVEVTPTSVRLLKKVLSSGDRYRIQRERKRADGLI